MDTNQLDSFDVDLLDRFTFEHIVKPFVSEYAKQQKEANEIDFVDAIIQATEICKTGDKKQYDYILVDEFQDISLDRYKFLQALRTDNPKTKLFCVGDDWQSIYRFAGSDMSLFKDFAKYFGYTKECRMETTYRFGEPLIHQSTDFILKNPDQKPKSIKSFQDNSQTRLEFVSVIDKESTIEKVIQILRAIPRDKEVLILGRYSSNVNVFKASIVNIRSNGHHTTLLFEGREISYLTVHQSKGLESDYVILLGCDSGSRGFPSEIDDAPILRYVLSAPDGYAFGEERRLFYVGLTRAREVTYVIYDSTKPSSFISEFTEVDNSSYQGPQEYIPQDQLCPRCQCGKIIEKKRGKAINGNPYAFYVCSNERYGCDYKETRFVNLNQRYRKHSNK